MKKRFLFSSLFLFVFTLSIHSLVIGLADLVIHAEHSQAESEHVITLTNAEKNCTDLLYQYLQERGLPERLRVERLNHLAFIQRPVNSALEAEEAAYLTKLEYIIFGRVKVTERYYDGEISIYSASEQKVISLSFAKDGKGDIESFMRTVESKLAAELERIFEVSLKKTDRKRDLNIFDYLLIYNASGYFLPMPDWWNVMTGLANPIETGIYFGIIPVKEVNRDVVLRLRFGQTTGYSLGINKPGLVQTYYNQFQIKFPVYFAVELFNRYGIFVEAGPAVQVDFIVQKESYLDDSVAATAAFSLFLATGFEYWFGEKRQVCLGVKNTFDLTFYEHFMADYRPQIYVGTKIEIKNRGE